MSWKWRLTPTPQWRIPSSSDRSSFAVCPVCGGTLKPDFVYFGENVPRDRVERAYAMVDEAAARRGGRFFVDGA